MAGLSIEEWAAQYEELPSVLCKVQVPDRLAIVTGDADRAILQPAGLQSRISALVARFPGGRAFARPSGTEDVVRVYAEAATVQAAESLARQVAQLIQGTLM
jgi:phosphoacetylglucosamine mutase